MGHGTGRPPAGDAARIFTVLGVFWLWLILPFAVYFQRKARREAETSNGLYVWPRSIWNRPLLLSLVVLVLGQLLIFAIAGLFGD